MNTRTARPDLLAEMNAVLARLPACFADSRARAGLQALARRLPQALVASPLGLELRLAGPTAVDVFAAATPGEAGFAALMDALRDPLDAPGWAEPARARDLAAVLARWQQRQGAIHAVARYLLVEVDAPAGPDDAVAVPSIFLAPRGARDFPRPSQLPNAFHRFVDATTIATAELSGLWPDPATAAALARVVAALSGDGDIFAVGAMLGRSVGASMRIAVRRLSADGMIAVLRAAGHAAQAEVLRPCIGSTPARQQVIHFEIGPGAESRVGLELSPAHDWKQARTDGWPALLDDLVARGVAEPSRAAAVTALVDPLGQPLWGLAHVKLAADAKGLLPFAKLYVGLLHQRPTASDVSQ